MPLNRLHCCRVLCYYVLCSLSGQVQRNLFLRKLWRIKRSVANLSEACRYGVARMFLKAPRSQEQNAPLVDNSVTSPFGVLVVGRAGFKVVCPHSRNIVVVYLTSARKNKKMTNTTLFTSVQHLFLVYLTKKTVNRTEQIRDRPMHHQSCRPRLPGDQHASCKDKKRVIGISDR